MGRDGGTLGRDGGTLGRDRSTLGRDGGTLGRDGGTLGREGGTLGRDGGTLGRNGGTLGRDRGTWRRDRGGAGSVERERERSLGRDGSLGRHGDLRGAELVQVAERQLSQIQHVHGYVTHTHIAPAQVTKSGSRCGFRLKSFIPPLFLYFVPSSQGYLNSPSCTDSFVPGEEFYRTVHGDDSVYCLSHFLCILFFVRRLIICLNHKIT